MHTSAPHAASPVASRPSAASRARRATVLIVAACGLVAAAPLAPGSAAPSAVFTDFRYEGGRPAQPAARPPAGEFRNPILSGSHSDPAIVRVGADFYLTTASFTLYPGAPVFRSRDLVHWRQVGAALSGPGAPSFKGLDTWQGGYANDLKAKDGVFYFLTTCMGCGGSLVETARDPAGPWSAPTFLPLEGIDPSIFFDDDGRAYVLASATPLGGERWPGHRAIIMQELDLPTLKLVGPRTALVDGGDDPSGRPFWLEGPHLLKHDGRYVLIAAQGGTKEAHAEVAFRADRLRGPYLADPHNPILSQNGLDPRRPHPVTQTGHADLVQTAAGDWWAVFLGSRPWSADPLAYNTGRETFLLPLTWRDGWPEILPPGAPVPLAAQRPRLPDAPAGEPHSGDFGLSETFASPRLGPEWVSLGAPETPWWRAGGGVLQLQARPDPLGGLGQPSLLAVRQQHTDFTAQVTVVRSPAAPGAQAGLAAYQGRGRSLAIAVVALPGGGREAQLLRVAAEADPATGVVAARAPLPPRGPVRLRLAVRGRDHAFGYAAAGGAWRALGPAQDGTMLSVSGSGGFTGTLVGPFATAPP